MMQSQTMTKAVDETGADHRGVQTLAAEYECIITLLKQLFFFFSFSGARITMICIITKSDWTTSGFQFRGKKNEMASNIQRHYEILCNPSRIFPTFPSCTYFQRHMENGSPLNSSMFNNNVTAATSFAKAWWCFVNTVWLTIPNSHDQVRLSRFYRCK